VYKLNCTVKLINNNITGIRGQRPNLLVLTNVVTY